MLVDHVGVPDGPKDQAPWAPNGAWGASSALWAINRASKRKKHR